MKLLILIGVVVILVVIICLLVINSKNKFDFLSIKLEEANSNISLYLLKKQTTLNNIIKILQDLGEGEEEFSDFKEMVQNEKDSFRLHSILSRYYSKLTKLLFDNEALSKNEDIINHLIRLKNNEEDLIGSIKFYNDTIVDYNGLINTFPHKVYARMHGLDNKSFYNNEKEELFDILK